MQAFFDIWHDTGYLLEVREGMGTNMEIYGFQKTTLLDYPGHVAATLFTGGCNFRCPFCHNGNLVLLPDSESTIAEEEILVYLKKRSGILEGVCITGGEPTLQTDLREFIVRVKELGYLIKLDTNGYRPQMLWKLLEEELLDYVAMDVKASLLNYKKATGCPGVDLSRIEESIAILKSSGIDYEFRTTVVKGIHTVAEFDSIGRLLEGAKAYYIQAYRENENVLSGGYEAFSTDVMNEMAEMARKYIDKVELRGVE